MIRAIINPTIIASRTAIITKNCVWLGEVDAGFFTESTAAMFVGLRVGIELGTEGLGFELCASTLGIVKDEGINVAVKKTAAKNKIFLFTLCAPIISLTLHINSET